MCDVMWLYFNCDQIDNKIVFSDAFQLNYKILGYFILSMLFPLDQHTFFLVKSLDKLGHKDLSRPGNTSSSQRTKSIFSFIILYYFIDIFIFFCYYKILGRCFGSTHLRARHLARGHTDRVSIEPAINSSVGSPWLRKCLPKHRNRNISKCPSQEVNL